MENINFTKNLIKGRIAETVFSQMLRDTKHFTVLEFGYEKIIPQLVQSGNNSNLVADTLRTAPDFAVINQKTKEVRLIEVKYSRVLNKEYVLRHAIKMSQAWNPSYLFIATLDGFYFDRIDIIIKEKGKITPFKNSEIPKNIINKYLKILIDFEKYN